jgi:hypothetical protein
MMANWTRRDVFLKLVGAACLAACDLDRAITPSCNDTRDLSPTDLTIRTSLAYVERSPEPKKTCDGCLQFVPGTSVRACGTCRFVKGPISPAGFCKAFVAKPA